MSEFKHTPGPWRTTPNGVVTSDSCQIAHVGETSRPADMVGSFERWDADARIIAAAPDLLEALCMLLDCVNTYAPEYMHGLPKKDYTHKALAALSKARGES